MGPCGGVCVLRRFGAVFLLLCVLLACLMTSELCVARRMWTIVESDFRLHTMARVLEANGLASFFDSENITVYLPTSEAYFQFDFAYFGIGDNDLDKRMDLLVFASQHGRFPLGSLPLEGRIPSRLNKLFLYVNVFDTPRGQQTTINGATIIQADIKADNGILHIVNRVIAPVGSHRTIAQYLKNPELPHLAFNAIMLASIVVPSLTEKTNDSKSLYTSFSPNDSYLYPMPDYGQDPLFNNFTILREVYKAHILKDKALFLPTDVTDIPTEDALFGSIRFYFRKGKLYISNNRVHARVVQPNLSTVNGVVHVIDNLLHYVFHTARQMAGSMPDAKIFAQLLDQMTDEQAQTLTNSTVTLFIPSDLAFSKAPIFWQNLVSEAGSSKLWQVVYDHVIEGVSLDASQLYSGQKLLTKTNKTLQVIEVDGELYLESADGLVRSHVEVLDVGVVNGVAHVISNVLATPTFTLWDVVSDIPELSRLKTLITKEFPELRNNLSTHSKRPMTAFLPADTAMDKVMGQVNTMLLNSRDTLVGALKGHLTAGRLWASEVSGETTHITFSPANNIIRVMGRGKDDDITVVGGHVAAKVIIKDVYCSNGIVHVIDDLLHVPTRTVQEEMSEPNELGYMKTLFTTLNEKLNFDLSSKDENFTVFVPLNGAFSRLPWDTVEDLLQKVEWTREVLNSHVVRNESRTLDQIESGSELLAEYNAIYVLKQDGKVFVVNNNMKAEVVRANIPATNGWIHVIDRILTVPYMAVTDVMTSLPELRLFHELMSPLPEYKQLMTSPLRKVTLFVPSLRYLQLLTDTQLDRIKASPDILRKLYYGHVIPNVRLDDVFLRQYPDDDYCSRTSYNVSFKISRNTEGMFVSVGFDEQALSPVQRATGCSDGIVYVIDGFLNYSPFTVLQRLKREPGLSVSFEHMSRLASPEDINLLDDPDLSFTFLMPDDLALDYFSFHQLLRLHSLPESDQHRTFWRHSINGSTFYYDDLKNGHMNPDVLPPDVSVDISNEDVYLNYRTVRSRVKRWNLIACNGVIHILMQFLFDFDEIDVKTNTPAVDPGSVAHSTSRPGAALTTGVCVTCSPALLLAGQVMMAAVLSWLVRAGR